MAFAVRRFFVPNFGSNSLPIGRELPSVIRDKSTNWTSKTSRL
jgi:hypothetical protein